MYGFEFSHVFIHFLFAIAGGFAHHEVGKVEVGAFVGLAKTVAAFYQRTEVARQILFGLFNRLVGGGTQRHHHRARGQRDLLRHKGAVGANQRNILLFKLHDREETLLAG